MSNITEKIEELLTVAEYADLQGVTKQSVYQRLKNQEWKSKHCELVDGKMFIKAASFDRPLSINTKNNFNNESKEVEQDGLKDENIYLSQIELLEKQLEEVKARAESQRTDIEFYKEQLREKDRQISEKDLQLANRDKQISVAYGQIAYFQNRLMMLESTVTEAEAVDESVDQVESEDVMPEEKSVPVDTNVDNKMEDVPLQKPEPKKRGFLSRIFRR